MYSIAVYHNSKEVARIENENLITDDDVKYVLSRVMRIDRPEDGFEYEVELNDSILWPRDQVQEVLKGFDPEKYIANL